MKTVKLIIDITSPEGRQIVEELKKIPDIVSFENDCSTVKDPAGAYHVSPDKTLKKKCLDEYIESDLFWELVESKREKFCADNGIV